MEPWRFDSWTMVVWNSQSSHTSETARASESDYNEKERWGCEDKGDSFPLNNPDVNISAARDGTLFHYQNCVSEKKWQKIEARFDQCVRGVKKIEFRCVQNYCNVNWWQ